MELQITQKITISDKVVNETISDNDIFLTDVSDDITISKYLKLTKTLTEDDAENYWTMLSTLIGESDMALVSYLKAFYRDEDGKPLTFRLAMGSSVVYPHTLSNIEWRNITTTMYELGFNEFEAPPTGKTSSFTIIIALRKSNPA